MMLQAQSRHLANTPLTPAQQQQQQQNCLMTTTRSTFEPRQMSDVIVSSSQRSTDSVTSDSAFKPRPLPVPVTRNSFRIDDILGEQQAWRDDASRQLTTSVSTWNRDECQSSTSTNQQRQSNSREVTERSLSDDTSQLQHRQRRQQHQQQEEEEQLHPSGDLAVHVDQRADNVDAVEERQRGSSLDVKSHRDSIPDLLPPHQHRETSGAQSRGRCPQPLHDSVSRSPADFHAGGVRPIPLGELNPYHEVLTLKTFAAASYNI